MLKKVMLTLSLFAAAIFVATAGARAQEQAAPGGVKHVVLIDASLQSFSNAAHKALCPRAHAPDINVGSITQPLL